MLPDKPFLFNGLICLVVQVQNHMKKIKYGVYFVSNYFDDGEKDERLSEWWTQCC